MTVIRNNKQIMLVIFSILFLAFIVGCTQNNETPTIIAENFLKAKGGTDIINISLIEENKNTAVVEAITKPIDATYYRERMFFTMIKENNKWQINDSSRLLFAPTPSDYQTIDKTTAEEIATKYVYARLEIDYDELISDAEIPKLVYLFNTTEMLDGYCVEFAFSYRKDSGLPARELDLELLRPSTWILFIRNDGRIESENKNCLCNVYTELC